MNTKQLSVIRNSHISVEDASKILGLSRSTIYKRRKQLNEVRRFQVFNADQSTGELKKVVGGKLQTLKILQDHQNNSITIASDGFTLLKSELEEFFKQLSEGK